MSKKSNIKPLVIDLETIPNKDLIKFLPDVKVDTRLKDPVKIQADLDKKIDEQVSKMSMDPMFNRVCCAGLYSTDGAQTAFMLDDESDDGERDLLLLVYDVMKDYDVYITFNGRGFDMRVLNFHNMRLGIRPGVELCQKKYNSETSKHVDLMPIFADKTGFVSMDICAKVFLGDQKTEGIDGGLVYDYWEMGEKEIISDYCLKDCELEFRLFELCLDSGLIPWL